MSKKQPYPRLDQGQTPAVTEEKEPLLIPSEDKPEDDASGDGTAEDESGDDTAVYIAVVTLVVGRDQSIPPGGVYPAADEAETESLLSRGLIRRRE